MQNDFEKEVKDTLDNLRLDPKPPVWQNIEAQIRRKKERRRVLFWLPLFGCLLAGGLWFILVNKLEDKAWVSKKDSTTKNKEHRNNSIPESADNKPSRQQNIVGKETNKDNFQPKITAPGLSPAMTYNNDNVPVKKAQQVKLSKPYVLQTNTAFKEKNTTNDNGNNKIVAETTANKTLPAREGSVQNKNAFSANDRMKLAAEPNRVNKDATADKEDISPTTATETKADSALNKPVVEEKKNAATQDSKWRWVATFTIGTGGLSNGLNVFGEKSAARADALYSAPATTSIGSGQRQSSAIRNGFSFSAGVVAKKTLTKRLQFTAGLQYSYISNHLSVGAYLQQDTMVSTGRINSFYANSGSNFTEKTNSFHFIGLPVGLQWQVHKRLPLMVQTNLSVQRLLSADLLLYDAGSNVYYSNNEPVNKTQVFMHLALGYEFFQHKKLSLLVGPHLNYSLTGFEKIPGSQHLFTAGFGLQLHRNR